ncbi:9913_t:CDS:2 [Gigaspora margarita]|uniref:MFS general substrate transporter n=3 Tax=Gigaspora margarita TaxID=4874 RepID=A0A8H3WYS6_GIGMA|nr:MFS general substrate transporter [Gigaspora margarita]CAG8480338.1 9913_t:CDS:2 [Gigaspora margarita]
MSNIGTQKKVLSSSSVTKATQTVRIVIIALLLDLLAFTIILPLFPRLLQDYREREGDDTTLLSWSLHQIYIFKQLIGGESKNPKWDLVLLGGALGSLYSFLQFVASPFIGTLSDRYGRRNILLATMIGNILSTLIWLFSKSFGLFVLSRIIAGLSEGNIQLSIAIISDVTSKESRSKGLALVGIAFSVSFTIGPAIGAFFSSKDLSQTFPQLVKWGLNPYSMPALVALILLSVETLYLYLFLPETVNLYQKSQSLQPSDTKHQNSNSTLSYHQTNTVSQRLSNLRNLNWIHFLFLFFFSGMEFTLTFLTFDLFNFTNMQNGTLLGYIGILSSILQGGYVRRMARVVGEKRLVVQGVLCCAISLTIIAALTKTSNGIMWLYIGATFLAITSATVVTCLNSIASMQCDDYDNDEQNVESVSTNNNENNSGNITRIAKGQTLGVYRSLGQLGRSAGPIMACGLYWMAGSEKCYGIGAFSMLIILGIVIVKVPYIPTQKQKSE